MHTARPKILVINGYDTVEGDVQTLLVALRGFGPELFDISVISKPRGDVYKQLRAIPHIKLYSMELGGTEAAPEGHGSKLAQLLDAARAVPQIVSFIRKHQIDAVFTIDRGIAPQLAALAARLTARPFCLLAAYPFYPQNGLSARLVLRQAQRIMVHSRYLYDHLLPHVSSPERLIVTPLGIEERRYDLNLTGEAARASYGIDQRSPVVVMMGRLNEYKGQDDLIRAAALLLPRYPDAHILISGRGPSQMQQYLEGLIAELGVTERVRLVGYVPSLPEFIAASNVVVMPSWEEPFGLVALEGMAMAKPVIATRAGGVPEFVLENRAGLLVEPRNPEALAAAIGQLFDDPDRARAMGVTGRQIFESMYTERHFVQRCVDVLWDLVRPGAAKPVKSSLHFS